MTLETFGWTALRQAALLAVFFAAYAITSKVCKKKRRLMPRTVTVLFAIIGIVIVLSVAATVIEFVSYLISAGV